MSIQGCMGKHCFQFDFTVGLSLFLCGLGWQGNLVSMAFLAQLGRAENLDMLSLLAVMTRSRLQPSIILGLLLCRLGLLFSVSTLRSLGFLTLQDIRTFLSLFLLPTHTPFSFS